MPFTRAQLEGLLVRTNKAKLAYAKLDSTTVDGTNADLSGPIATALRSLRIFPAEPASPTDSDLLLVSDQDAAQLVDIADLALNEAILGNRASPDQMADTDNQQWHGKFYDSLEATVARKQARCEKAYGYGLPPLSSGSMSLRFQGRTPPGLCGEGRR